MIKLLCYQTILILIDVSSLTSITEASFSYRRAKKLHIKLSCYQAITAIKILKENPL
ncbi:hypothetical protein OSCI_4000002 [Kamptonema sp. PCC 6506]|nr:hypothetical protein OSCI_4000002 [Kamptonema sp. PCC 6506]